MDASELTDQRWRVVKLDIRLSRAWLYSTYNNNGIVLCPLRWVYLCNWHL
jgi:hypothetical protein